MKKFGYRALVAVGMLAVLPGCGVKTETAEFVRPRAAVKPVEPVEVSPEEQEFLDSGRAKAIVDETDLWKLYEDDATGLLLRYPNDVSLAGDRPDARFRLDVDVKPVTGLDGTMGYNEETATENREALNAGEYGKDVDFPLLESKKVRMLDGMNAQEFMVLGRFDVCDVTLERKLYFFRGDRQVVITLSVQDAKAVAEESGYFIRDEANCGSELVWNRDKQKLLYDDLVAGSAEPELQEWYDLFDLMAETVVVEDEAPPGIVGRWQAVDDEKSVVEFTDSEKTDYYDGEPLFVGNYQVDPIDRLTVVSDEAPEETFVYKVVEASADRLVLVYLDRGNTLEYRRLSE